MIRRVTGVVVVVGMQRSLRWRAECVERTPAVAVSTTSTAAIGPRPAGCSHRDIRSIIQRTPTASTSSTLWSSFFYGYVAEQCNTIQYSLLLLRSAAREGQSDVRQRRAWAHHRQVSQLYQREADTYSLWRIQWRSTQVRQRLTNSCASGFRLSLKKTTSLEFSLDPAKCWCSF